MAINFKKHAQVADAFVADLADKLREPRDVGRAGRVLRAVLHTLRDQMSPAESLQMIAQLPMFIKAIYVEGWKISGKPRKIRNYFDFIDEVRSPDRGTLSNDFFKDEEVEEAIYAVLGKIRDKVSWGEISDVLDTLPKEIRPFLAGA